MGKSTFCHICLKKHFRCGRIISVPPCTLHCCSACHCAYSCVFSSPASDGPFIVGWCPAAPSLAQPSRMIASVSGSMRMLFLPHHASPLLALSLLPTSPPFLNLQFSAASSVLLQHPRRPVCSCTSCLHLALLLPVITISSESIADRRCPFIGLSWARTTSSLRGLSACVCVCAALVLFMACGCRYESSCVHIFTGEISITEPYD